jgi:hypothetical protein
LPGAPEIPCANRPFTRRADVSLHVIRRERVFVARIEQDSGGTGRLERSVTDGARKEWDIERRTLTCDKFRFISTATAPVSQPVKRSRFVDRWRGVRVPNCA